MNADSFAERLRRLSGSQQSIQSLSATCIRQPDSAKEIVRAWKSECEHAAPDRKLIYLYLANDILQNARKQGPEFADEFVAVVPRTVRHLYKFGPEKLRKAVSRLVGIWEDRKVLASSAIKLMRDCLRKETREARRPVIDKEEGVRKRLKPMDTLAKCAWEAEVAAKRRQDWHAVNQTGVQQGIQSKDMEQLEMAGNKLSCYETVLRVEVNAREHYAGQLKKCLKEQEETLAEAQDSLQMCLIQQETVRKSLESSRDMEMEPCSSMLGSPGSPQPPQQVTASVMMHSLAASFQSPVRKPEQVSPPEPVLNPSQMQSQPIQPQSISPSCGQPHLGGEGPNLPPPPPPLPPAYPMKQAEAPMGTPHWDMSSPPTADFNGFEGSLTTQPPGNGAWPIPQYPPNQNGDMDICADVANQLAAAKQPAAVLASALGTLPQETQDEFGFSVASSLNQPQFGYNAGSWSN